MAKTKPAPEPSLLVESVTEVQAGEEQVSPRPPIHSVDWTPYVMSQLQPDEVWDGCPTYEGLRRLAFVLLGTPVKAKPTVVQAPNKANGNHSCAEFELVIEHFADAPWLGGLQGKTAEYGGVADVFVGNGDTLFSWRYSSATCETRAKSRAYRDAFQLRHVRVKEEMSELKEEECGADGWMNNVQINALKMIGKRINLNVREYLNSGASGKKYASINEVPFGVAQEALGHIQGWQQDLSKIPTNLLGYNPDWAD